MRKLEIWESFDLGVIREYFTKIMKYLSEQEEFDILQICEIFDENIKYFDSNSWLDESQFIVDFLKKEKEKVIRENSKEGVEKVIANSFKELLDLIFKLYDLTELDESNWQNFFYFSIPIPYLEELDLSQSGINFCLNSIGIKRSSKGKRVRINCNGCNVNFESDIYKFAPHYSYYEINEDLFDENTREKNPKIFLSNIFSKEFKDKYYSRLLDINDILELSDEQIEELNKKEFIKYFYHPVENNNLFLFLIKFVDLKRVLEFYKNNKNDYQYLEILLNNERLASWMRLYSNYKSSFENDLSKIKLEFNNYLRKNIEINKCHYDSNRIDFQWIVVDDIISNQCFDLEMFEGKLEKCNVNYHIEYLMRLDRKRRFNTCYPSDFPKEFVDFNKDLFLFDIDVSDEIRQRYYERKLTKEDETLLNKLIRIDTYYFMEGYEQQVIDDELVEYYGEEILEEKNKKYKKIIEFLRRHGEMYEYFKMYFDYEYAKCENFDDLLTKENFQYLLKMIFYTDYDKKLFEVVFNKKDVGNSVVYSLKSEYQDIFGWLDFKIKSGYQSFEDMKESDDTLVINETFFPNYLVMWFGYENFYRFCTEANFFASENKNWDWDTVVYWIKVFAMRIYEFKNSKDELIKLEKDENLLNLSLELKRMGRTALIEIEEVETYEEFIEYICNICKSNLNFYYDFKQEFERLFKHLEISDVSNPKIKKL